MRRHVQSRAVILSGRDLGESDRLMTFLSEGLGRLSAVAKGAKRSQKRFGGALELFSLVEVNAVDSGRDLLRLESCDLVQPFPALRADLSRYACACYLCELARELFPDREPAQGAFRLLSHALERLEAGDAPLFWQCVGGLRLLALAGFVPELSTCQGCGSRPEGKGMLFVPGQTRVFCARCLPAGAEALEVSAGTLLSLSEALRLELPRLSRLRLSRPALAEGEALLTALVRQVLGRDLKSQRFLEEVRSGPRS